MGWFCQEKIKIIPSPPGEQYKVSALTIKPNGKPKEHPVRIGLIKDNGDGTTNISLELIIPKHGAVLVTVEVEL